MNLRRTLVCCCIAALWTAATPCGAQSLVDPAAAPADAAEAVNPPTVATDAELDRQTVYRFVPAVEGSRLGQRLAAVASDDLKPKSIYYRFHPQLGRHAWSVLADDGQWYFALGPGSTVRTELLDIRLTPQQRIDVLETFAPRLKQKLEEPDKAKSINLYLRLGENDEWRLQGDSLTPKVQSVFDLPSGRRWEWHGERRHAVLHTTGDMWQVIDGKYVPVSINLGLGVIYDGCHRRPAGSILNVVRTSSTMPPPAEP